MESNRWAICINLNNLKEFDDLFENKEEIVSCRVIEPTLCARVL